MAVEDHENTLELGDLGAAGGEILIKSINSVCKLICNEYLGLKQDEILLETENQSMVETKKDALAEAMEALAEDQDDEINKEPIKVEGKSYFSWDLLSFSNLQLFHNMSL